MQSLKLRLIFIFIFILLSILVLLFTDSKILKEIDLQGKRLLKVERIHTSLLQMRRAEKDFLTRKDIKYYNNFLTLIEKNQEHFDSIGLKKYLTAYAHTFKIIVTHMKDLGLSNSRGLKAEFIFHTNRLENDLTEDNHTNILIKFLLMRKYEKDFFLLQDTKQLKLRRDMIKNIKQDHRLKMHTNILLDNYNFAFINLKTLMLIIGLNENLGLHKEMRDITHKIEDELHLYIDYITPIIEKNVITLYQTRSIIYITLLLIIFTLMFFFLLPIYKTLKYFKEFFSHFNDAKERMDLENIQFSELKSIATVINTMLQSRQKIEANLIKSKDDAQKLQKVKEEFLTNMSHELRTPLNAIIGFSSILAKKLPQEKKLIHPINTSSKHLLQIINDILDISKIQSGHFRINKDVFSPQDSLDSCLSKFKFNAEEKNINFTINTNIISSLKLYGDWLRISQVINNFLSNAFKFTPDNGTISVTLNFNKNQLYITVKDSGIGISKEAQERILNPFEQADSSTTKNFGGTGLGLSISNSIVQMMGGTIQIQSQENKGSEFSFTIPIEQRIEETKEVIENYNEVFNINAHILIAEDNKTNQMLLSMLLEDVGITFDIANDGQEAVEMYQDNLYDIVLMDENMPNLSGVDAMLKIRENHNNVCPIIVVTANVMKGDEQRLLELGMDAFIPKPIDDNELFSTIEKFLKPSQV